MTEPFHHKSRLHDPADNRIDNAPVLIAMGVAAVSGFVMGLLVRGDLMTSALVFVSACACAIIGWWARGVR